MSKAISSSPSTRSYPYSILCGTDLERLDRWLVLESNEMDKMICPADFDEATRLSASLAHTRTDPATLSLPEGNIQYFFEHYLPQLTDATTKKWTIYTTEAGNQQLSGKGKSSALKALTTTVNQAIRSSSSDHTITFQAPLGKSKKIKQLLIKPDPHSFEYLKWLESSEHDDQFEVDPKDQLQGVAFTDVSPTYFQPISEGFEALGLGLDAGENLDPNKWNFVEEQELD